MLASPLLHLLTLDWPLSLTQWLTSTILTSRPAHRTYTHAAYPPYEQGAYLAQGHGAHLQQGDEACPPQPNYGYTPQAKAPPGQYLSPLAYDHNPQPITTSSTLTVMVGTQPTAATITSISPPGEEKNRLAMCALIFSVCTVVLCYGLIIACTSYPRCALLLLVAYSTLGMMKKK